MAIRWTFRRTFNAYYYWMKLDDTRSPPLTESYKQFASLRDALNDASKSGLVSGDMICFGPNVFVGHSIE